MSAIGPEMESLKTRLKAMWMAGDFGEVAKHIETGAEEFIARLSLKPGAREKLARIAGILASHPDLKIEIEGHADSTGSTEYNQGLSERRAQAVRSYFNQQGVTTPIVAAVGFGETRPVATNGTAAGRQQNRRVEIIVSGASIGRS